jgi:hypothetical protein
MTMKADGWRRTATVYMLTAALMVLLTVATWPKPVAVVEAFTAGIAVGAAIMTFAHLPMRRAYDDMSHAFATMGQSSAAPVAPSQDRQALPFVSDDRTTTQPGRTTCEFCRPMCAATEIQLANQLKSIQENPDIKVSRCSKCGSTDWATTDEFVVRGDDRQSASGGGNALPSASEPSA